MKAVILESYVMQEGDLDWSGLRALVPDTVEYVRTPYEEIARRIGDAELVVLNKCRMDEAILAQCPNLRWVGIIATGTDNLDLAACRRHGVKVANVPAYSTYSVAQMAFSLLLTVCQCPERQDRALRDGYWQLDIPAKYGILPQVELYGKTFGVCGYGNIGRQTARLAQAFGMRVLAGTRTVRPEYAADGVEFVDFDTLLKESDVLSLHTPATPATRGLIGAEALARMKPGAVLLNTARGALVDTQALVDATPVLHHDWTQAAAALSDALSETDGATVTVSADSGHCERLLSDGGAAGLTCYALDPETAQAARDAGLSLGKYRAYLALSALDPTVTQADAGEMTMGEIQQSIDACEGHGYGQGQQGSGQGSGQSQTTGETTSAGQGYGAGQGAGGHHGQGHGYGHE